MKRWIAMLLAAPMLFSCAMAETGGLDLNREVKSATAFTAQANAAVYDELDFSDKQEYAFATRGLIDAPETLELKDEDGRMIWSQDAFAFLDDYEKAPDSVNPSLWENTINNHVYGLFEVADGIYQVRGYDMANLTVVKGDTGWIVFDTLMSVECSQAAMQLIEKNLGHFPVKAVVISHSHVDHFGGIAGVMAAEDKADETLSIEEQLASGKIPVIAPAGFTEHAVKENVYAGKGMGRRSNYQYGILLKPGVTGKLAQGIGMGQSVGTISFMTPSYEIKESGERLTIDGVEQPLSAMLQLNQISLEELGEYRAVNDGTIAGWAARRRTDEDLAALDSCLTAAEQALGDYRRFAELDVRFHSLLSRATGNQVAMIVTDVLGQVEQHTLLKKMETLNDSACLALERRILARHREILSAIHRQDDAAAKQAMREHTRAAATDLKV